MIKNRIAYCRDLEFPNSKYYKVLKGTVLFLNKANEHKIGAASIVHQENGSLWFYQLKTWTWESPCPGNYS